MLSNFHRMNSWIYLLFSLFVAFNLLDLSTTIIALRLGMSEANSMLLFFSNLSGIGVIDFFLVIKAVFIAGVGSLVLIAVRSHNSRTTLMVFLAETAFTLVFFLVALSNILVIASF